MLQLLTYISEKLFLKYFLIIESDGKLKAIYNIQTNALFKWLQQDSNPQPLSS